MAIHSLSNALDAAVVQKILMQDFGAVALGFAVVGFDSMKVAADVVSQDAPVGYRWVALVDALVFERV